MQTETESNPVHKVAELIKDIRTAMLVTTGSDGKPHCRPMATQDAEFDGTVWFLTDIESAMVMEIAVNPTVAIAYSSPARESYVSLTGQAGIFNDRERIRDYWSSYMKAWWDGPEDPRIRLMKVDVEQAEYWDTPGGKVASLLALVKSAVTGKNADQDNEHEKVKLS
jgi:general stress protein 26